MCIQYICKHCGKKLYGTENREPCEFFDESLNKCKRKAQKLLRKKYKGKKFHIPCRQLYKNAQQRSRDARRRAVGKQAREERAREEYARQNRAREMQSEMFYREAQNLTQYRKIAPKNQPDGAEEPSLPNKKHLFELSPTSEIQSSEIGGDAESNNVYGDERTLFRSLQSTSINPGGDGFRQEKCDTRTVREIPADSPTRERSIDARQDGTHARGDYSSSRGCSILVQRGYLNSPRDDDDAQRDDAQRDDAGVRGGYRITEVQGAWTGCLRQEVHFDTQRGYADVRGLSKGNITTQRACLDLARNHLYSQEGASHTQDSDPSFRNPYLYTRRCNPGAADGGPEVEKSRTATVGREGTEQHASFLRKDIMKIDSLLC